MLICPTWSAARERKRKPRRSSPRRANGPVRPRRSSGHVTPGFRGRGRGPKRGRTWPRGPGIPTPGFDQDSFPGIEDDGRLALLEMILISELLREGDLAFRADCRRLRHRPMIGLSGIISLLQVKKYYSEFPFPGHTETQGHRFA